MPFDTGTTYRPGTRFGPQAVRRISAVYNGYSVDGGVDIFEELDICDAGDVFVIPGNIEKSFDQVSKAISHIYTSGAFPIICGGDHSLGYPNVRGIAPHIDGNVGIIHFDRHIDMQDMDMDERMHTTPWYWTSNDLSIDAPSGPRQDLLHGTRIVHAAGEIDDPRKAGFANRFRLPDWIEIPAPNVHAKQDGYPTLRQQFLARECRCQ